MKKNKEHIENFALGCKVGQAYYIMLGQLAESLKTHGLDVTAGEYLILRAVYSKEGLQQCEIADMVGKDKAAVCRSVSAMQQKGLLRTEVVSHKCLRVFLTDKSREMRPKIMALAESRYKALMDLTSPSELEIFSRILDKIINSK